MTQTQGLARSIQDRLRNRSRQGGEDFQFLLQRYAAERFLFRLGESAYRSRLVLKGGMLHALWGGSACRPTRDLDFTGYVDPAPEAVLAAFREILATPAPEDGLTFDAATLAVEPIRQEVEYGGLRLRFLARIGTARVPMQVDVGFGDAIAPGPEDAVYPALLDAPAPRIHAYPREAVVAEKLHAMVVLGERNTRFKDFYDVYVLAGQFGFEGARLAQAIAATFERRRTRPDDGTPAALTTAFYADPARGEQWRAYLRKAGGLAAPAGFEVVGERQRAFLGPMWQAQKHGAPFGRSWSADRGWA